MLSLAEYLRQPLENTGRIMDICEMNLLCAISYYLSNKEEKAFCILDETIPIIKERRFDRLVADEGEKYIRYCVVTVMPEESRISIWII